MMSLRALRKWLGGMKGGKDVARPSEFFCLGFHGDRYLIDTVDLCFRRANQFIETGANVGSTLAYVAREYPKANVYSCEPDRTAFETARAHVDSCSHVTLLNLPSPDIFRVVMKDDPEAVGRDTVFWLDAHCYGYQWPLRAEIESITRYFERGYIFIDDFKVPGMACFKYYVDDGRECSYEYIQGSLSPGLRYRLYYPDYSEKTSQHHPLVGWGLIEYGHADPLLMPDTLKERIRGPLDVPV